MLHIDEEGYLCTKVTVNSLVWPSGDCNHNESVSCDMCYYSNHYEDRKYRVNELWLFEEVKDTEND